MANPNKYEAFCREYIKDFNGTQAAIRAGYSEKTAEVQASQLLSKLKVQEKLKELIDKMEEEAISTGQKVIAEFAKIAFSNDSSQFPDMPMKIQDKLKALENLGRVHGIYEVDNNQTEPKTYVIIEPKKE